MKKTLSAYRWQVVALLFFATTINYLDRQVIGLLKPSLEKTFEWSEQDYSYIVIAFSASYALGLLFAGRLIDKIGTRMGYAISVVIWSVAAMAHAFTGSTLGFMVARAFLGFGESGNFPAAIKTVSEWFPKKERALATGIFNSGTNIGAVLSPLAIPWLMSAYGWEEAFLITGGIGFVWLAFWLILYRKPEDHGKVSESELQYIRCDATAAVDQSYVSWKQLLGKKQTWVFIVGKLLPDPVWWFYLFWLQSYLSNTFHISLAKPSWPLIIIYSATTVGSIGGGYLSSWFIQKGWPVYKSRKTAMLITSIAVMPVMLIQFTGSLSAVVLIISIAAAAHQAWSANMYTTVSDMFPSKVVSSVVGIGSMAGAAGGILFPFVIGILLDHYKALGNIGAGYNIIFVYCGLAYSAALVLIHFISPKMEEVSFAGENIPAQPLPGWK